MARWAGFGAGFAGGIGAGLKLGSVVREGMDQSELAEAMKNATTEEKSTVTEVDAPDAQTYAKDSETDTYVPKAFDDQGELTDYGKQIQDSTAENPVAKQWIEPQYESKTERVDKQFASPAEKRAAMLQMGIDFWTQKGDTDKALDLQDKMEQHTLRQLQVKGAERSERQAQEEEDDKKYYKENIAANFHGIKKAQQNAAMQADYEKQNTAYQEALKNNSGNPAAAGIAPQKPALLAVTPTEQLQDAALHMQYMTSKGKVSPTEQLQFMQMAKGVQKEVGTDTFKLLHAGDIQGAVKAFEAQGDMKVPEGAKVDARKAVFEADGQKIPTYELVVTLPNGEKHVFNGAQGLYAMDAADKIIQHAYQNENLKLQKQQVGIAGASLNLQREKSAREGEKHGVEMKKLAREEEAAEKIYSLKGLYADSVANNKPEEANKYAQQLLARGVKDFLPDPGKIQVKSNPMGGFLVYNDRTGNATGIDADWKPKTQFSIMGNGSGSTMPGNKLPTPPQGAREKYANGQQVPQQPALPRELTPSEQFEEKYNRALGSGNKEEAIRLNRAKNAIKETPEYKAFNKAIREANKGNDHRAGIAIQQQQQAWVEERLREILGV